MVTDQQDQRGPFGVTSTSEATHQLHEGTRAMATRYSTYSPDSNQSKEDIAAQLLPLLAAFESGHKDEPGFLPGQVGYVALRTLIFNAQHDAGLEAVD